MDGKKIILVTGGTGLIGSAIKYGVEQETDKAEEEWIFLSSRDGDLCDIGVVRGLFGRYKPTHVIHLAAAFGGLFYVSQKNLEVFRTCMRINDNVLATCFKYGVKKVVSCSSSSMFPYDVKYPVTEDQIHIGPPHPSVFGYGFAKRMIEVYNRGYNLQKKGTLFTTVIPSNVFGPNDNFNIETGQVIPTLIHKVYRAMQNNTDLVLTGSGEQRRQLLYSRDVARLFIWVMREYGDEDPLILTVDEKDEVSIRQVTNVVTESMGFKGTIKSKQAPVEGLFRKTASNDKLKSYQPNFKFTPFKEAVKETCDWFVKNYEDARK